MSDPRIVVSMQDDLLVVGGESHRLLRSYRSLRRSHRRCLRPWIHARPVPAPGRPSADYAGARGRDISGKWPEGPALAGCIAGAFRL